MNKKSIIISVLVLLILVMLYVVGNIFGFGMMIPQPSEESKYGSSRLRKDTYSGDQMSDPWINGKIGGPNGPNRLEVAVGIAKADEIRNFGYQRILSSIDANGNVSFKSINADGSVGSVINLN